MMRRASLFIVVTLSACAGTRSSTNLDRDPPPAPAESLAETGTYFVDVAGRPFVVLDGEPAEAIDDGPTTLVVASDLELAMTRGVRADVSERYGELAAGSFVLFDADGEVCRAEAVGIVELRHHYAEFGPEEDRAPLREADGSLDGAWENAAFGRALAVALRVEGGGSCDGARVARPARIPPLAILPRMRATASAEMLRAVAATPAYAEVQARYTEEGYEGAWHAHDNAGADAFNIGTPEGEVVIVIHEVGFGCGDFSARQAWLLRRASETAGWAVVAFPAEREPTFAADVDGDGRVEWFDIGDVTGGWAAYAESPGGAFRVLGEMSVESLVCAC